MPRQARIVLPNCPHHIIQRGHNRQDVFTCDDDYLYYLDNLRKLKEEFKCEVYAYCLMTNHVLCGAPHKMCYVKPVIM